MVKNSTRCKQNMIKLLLKENYGRETKKKKNEKGGSQEEGEFP